MKIILEGTEGTGKTTLAHQWCKLFGFEYRYCTKETPNTREYFEALLNSPSNTVIDRFHLGQFVYEPTQKIDLPSFEDYLIAKRIYGHVRFVYVAAKLSLIKERLRERSKTQEEFMEQYNLAKETIPMYEYFLKHVCGFKPDSIVYFERENVPEIYTFDEALQKGVI